MWIALIPLGSIFTLMWLCNIYVGIRRFSGRGSVSGLPILTSIIGILVAAIVALHFHWIPLHWCVALAVFSDIFLMFGEGHLSKRMARGFVPLDRRS